MDDVRSTPRSADAEVYRLQAEEHPLIEDAPPTSPEEHCGRLMHLKAYEEAATYAVGRDVLDVGCNTGYGTVRFAAVARRVVGVDVSPRAIEVAVRRASGGSPEFLLTEGGDLPFPDGSFDLVTAFQVLEHVPEPHAFLGELKRVLRPGGRVILTTPNAATRLYPGMRPWYRFHVYEYVAEELRGLLADEFERVRVRGMFGTATLYDTEIRRVDSARRRIVRREAEARATEARAAKAKGKAARPRPLVRVARAVVPRSVRARARRLLGRPVPAAGPPPVPPSAQDAGGPSMDLETFLRFTPADLFYADTDLDRAMDLLAICESAPAAAAGDGAEG